MDKISDVYIHFESKLYSHCHIYVHVNKYAKINDILKYYYQQCGGIFIPFITMTFEKDIKNITNIKFIINDNIEVNYDKKCFIKFYIIKYDEIEETEAIQLSLIPNIITKKQIKKIIKNGTFGDYEYYRIRSLEIIVDYD